MRGGIWCSQERHLPDEPVKAVRVTRRPCSFKQNRITDRHGAGLEAEASQTETRFMSLTFRTRAAIVAVLAALAAGARCGGRPMPHEAAPAEVRTFLDGVDATLKRLLVQQNQAGWVAQTFISPDTEAMDARATQEAIEAVARFAGEATRFDGVEVAADERRQLDLLKLSLVMAASTVPDEAEELTSIAARMRSAYGTGKWCPDPAKPEPCLNIDDVTRIMASSRDPAELRRIWEGWHTISPPMRDDYARFVELSNKGATGARASPTPARCGARSTTCRPTRSRRSSIGSGIRCGRSTCSCTPTCG